MSFLPLSPTTPPPPADPDKRKQSHRVPAAGLPELSLRVHHTAANDDPSYPGHGLADARELTDGSAAMSVKPSILAANAVLLSPSINGPARCYAFVPQNFSHKDSYSPRQAMAARSTPILPVTRQDVASIEDFNSSLDVGHGRGEPRALVRSASASNLLTGGGDLPRLSFASSLGSSSSIYHSAGSSPSVGSSTLLSYSQGQGSPPGGHSSSPPSPPPADVGGPESSSSVDLAICAICGGAMGAIVSEIKGITSSWSTEPKVLFGTVAGGNVALVGIGIIAAWYGRRRLSGFCARSSTILTTGLSTISMSCLFGGRVACVAGVAGAGVVGSIMTSICIYEKSAKEAFSRFRGRRRHPKGPAAAESVELACI